MIAAAMPLLLLAMLQDVALQPCETVEPMTNFGKRYRLGETLDTARIAHPVEEGGSRYMRVRVQAHNSQSGSWLLGVRDSQHRLLQTLGPEDFVSSTDRWTMRVPGSEVNFTLEKTAGSGVVIKFPGYDAMPEKTTTPFYSLQVKGQEQYGPLYLVTDIATRHLGDTVGMLLASEPSLGPTPLWVCSGVVVAPDLFLTNWHCGGTADAKWTPEILARMSIDLSWDDDAMSRDYAVTGLAMLPNKELDFALLKIAPLVSLGTAPAARLRDAKPTGALRIVHHPAAHQKRISVCSVTNDAYSGWQDGGRKTRMTHTCDTESGSSGAPVFDVGGAVVALHHHGFERDSRCEPTDKLNKAIRMDAILESIRNSDPAVYARLRVVTR